MARPTIAAAIFIGGLVLGSCKQEPEQVFPEELVIGTVSGTEVRRGLFDAYVRYGVSLPDEPPAGDSRDGTRASKEIFSDEVRSRLLDRFLIERAMVLEARAAGTTVTEQDLDLFSQASGLGPLDDFVGNMPLTQREYLRAYLEDSLLVKRYLERTVRAQVQVSDAEVEQFWSDNPALFDVPTRVRLRTLRVESLRTARNISRRIGKSRDKFLEVTTEMSADEDEHGKDLGSWRLDDLPESFGEAIAKLEPGTVSGVVQDADGGFNVILLEEYHDGQLPPFEQVREHVRSVLERRRRDAAIRRYVELSSETADVEVFPEQLDFDYIRETRANAAPNREPPTSPTPNGGAS